MVIIFCTLKTELYNVTMVNITEWHNFGADLNILSTNFYDFFAGITVVAVIMLSLALCMLFFAKVKVIKYLAKAALLLCLFNVNEPILYGVPIIFNPVMIIPFLLVPASEFCYCLWCYLYWYCATLNRSP